MKLAIPALIFGTGIFTGILFVLSCSDSSPRHADAADAACNCPAAEPPITSARIVQIEASFTIPANTSQSPHSVICPQNGIAVSGGCAANAGQLPKILLEQSIPGDTGWACSWSNTTNADIPVRAIVRCLVPPL
jgi:hypothetical protein